MTGTLAEYRAIMVLTKKGAADALADIAKDPASATAVKLLSEEASSLKSSSSSSKKK